MAGRPVTIGGIAKGVGMLEPHLATMFCFMATDAMVAADALQSVLRRAVDRSFNRITVDSDQSTSDTVAVLANGLAENTPLERGGRGLRQFAAGLEALTARLARLLVEDGEGATKLVEIRAARRAHTAGRAAGGAERGELSTGQDRDLRRRSQLGPHHDGARQVAGAHGRGPGGDRHRRRDAGRAGDRTTGVRLDQIREVMARHEYTITIDLGLGRGEDHVWTCDLTEEYVRLNSKYTT